jgi:hypothetical protein
MLKQKVAFGTFLNVPQKEVFLNLINFTGIGMLTEQFISIYCYFNAFYVENLCCTCASLFVFISCAVSTLGHLAVDSVLQ